MLTFERTSTTFLSYLSSQCAPTPTRGSGHEYHIFHAHPLVHSNATILRLPFKRYSTAVSRQCSSKHLRAASGSSAALSATLSALPAMKAEQ